jgi:hypothetical protein
MHKIAKELDVSVTTVFNYMKKYGIESRDHKETFTMKGHKLSLENCKRIGDLHRGKVLSEETKLKISEGHKVGGIGHKKVRSDGYIYVYFIDHPKSSAEGYIMEHILVMEAIIGRHLLDNECVHHKNEKRSDNRKENLELMTKSEHMSYHAHKRHDEKKRRTA